MPLRYYYYLINDRSDLDVGVFYRLCRFNFTLSWKHETSISWIFNPFATENVDIRFEGLALTPVVRKNTFFSKKPSQTINIVTSVIFMVEWKVNQFWNAQDFADSKLVYFSFYHKKYGSCDFFNKTSCFKKRRSTPGMVLLPLQSP